MSRRGPAFRLLACTLVGAILPAAASAQSRELVGVVVDDANQPVRDARITILSTLLRSESRPDGRFRIAFPAGDQQVRVVRLGHHPAELTVLDVAVARGDTLLVRLLRAPSQLLGVLVPGERTVAFGQTATRATIRQLAPLGEPDVMRALPLLPGVLQPNDMLGRVHLAGAAGDESLITLDGHPMQSPAHLSGIIGGFNVGAIDRVEVLAHHVPATMDSRLGGIIALESRERSVASKGEVVTTLLASSATAYVPDLTRRIDLLASARVTYMDQLHRRVYGAARARGDQIPSYGDALVRVGIPLDGHATWSLEGIGYLARDWTGVDAAGGDIGRSFSERLAGLTLSRVGARTTLQFRISQDQADSRVGQEARPDQRTLLGDQRLTSTSVRVQRRFGESLLADLSLSVDQRAHRHEWYRGAAEAVGLPANFRSDRRQVASAAASSVEILLPDGSSVSAGVRLHVVGGGTQLAPRLRYSRPVGSGRIDLALDRRLQFDTQFGEPLDGKVPPATFLLDRPRAGTSVAATYEVTMGRATGRWVALSATAFARSFADRTVPILVSDTLLATSLSFDRTEARSVGFANGFTAALGRGGVIQGSYTFSTATDRDPLDAVWRPSLWDVRHTLAILGSVPVSRRWTLSSTFQLRSGLPVTPIATSVLVPNPVFPGQLIRRLVPGDKNSARLPAFRRLDLGLRRRWSTKRFEMDLTLQVVNVLATENVLAYDWQIYLQQREFGGSRLASRAGVPLVPSIGFEVRW